ncbi:MAG: hypothetical protein AAB572_01995 [Patescibacteria group bacterium]
MPPKKFEIFKTEPNHEEEPAKVAQQRILKIINAQIIEAQISKISQGLHNELHREKRMNTLGEISMYEDAREDVYLSFGIPDDKEHCYLMPGKEGIQRAYRAFVVFIDRKKTDPKSKFHEAFYGEGRTSHNHLLQAVIDKANEYGIKDASLESYIAETEKKSSSDFTFADLPKDPEATQGPRWLFFKGFLIANEDEINHLPLFEREKIEDLFATRNKMEEHISDESGEIPTETLRWFLTGSNVPSSHHLSENNPT